MPTPTPTPSVRAQFLIPAYFFPSPSSPWVTLTNIAAANRDVTITAIMNPGSGPGSATIQEYVTAINNFTAAGGRVLVYVASGNLGRTTRSFEGCAFSFTRTVYTPQDVVDCARRYQTLYPTLRIDGVFVDEMVPRENSGDTDAAAISFYSQVYSGLKGLNSNWLIVGNPGRSVPQGYLRQGSSGGADVLVTYESFTANYASTSPQSYVFNFPATRFVNILHTAPQNYNFTAFLNLAQSRNVSYVYVTDDIFVPSDPLSNPYDTLPTNFAAQVSAVRTFNVGK